MKCGTTSESVETGAGLQLESTALVNETPSASTGI